MKLRPFGKDVWITDEPVPPHTDGTIEGMLSYGLILANTGHVLIYNGKRIEIPVGSIYKINARKQHSTEGTGILLILVWDMPNWTIESFKQELKNDVRFSSLSEPDIAFNESED